MRHIRRLDGQVNSQYETLPIVAASIPVDTLADLGSLRGVTKIEKDRLFYLDTVLDGRKNDERPMAFEAEARAGFSIEGMVIDVGDFGELPDVFELFLTLVDEVVFCDPGGGRLRPPPHKTAAFTLKGKKRSL